MASELIPNGYLEWLEALKGRIKAARSRAALAVNAELIRLYHQIGHDILQRQTQHGWGAKVIERVARYLKATFPDMKGFSTSNLKYMRYFAEHCPDVQFGQQPADQLPWFHIVTLLTKLESAEREWYAIQTVAQYAVNGIANPSAWPSTNSWRTCLNPCCGTCRALKRLRLSWRGAREATMLNNGCAGIRLDRRAIAAHWKELEYGE